MPKLPIIPYYSRLQNIWNILILTASMLFSLIISYRLVFHKVSSFDLLTITLVLLYGLDILFQFCFAVKNRLTILEDRKSIARNYLKGWFTIDLLAFVTLEGLFELPKGSPDTSPWYWIVFIFQATTLLKLVKVPFLLKHIQEFFSLNPALMRLLSFAFWFVLAVHFIALGWILIGAADTQTAANAARSPSDQYLRALYWAVTTVATIGYGDYYPNHDSNVQIIYTIMVQIFGVGIFSYIIGNVAGLIANLDVAKAQFTKKVEEVKDFMRAKKVPVELQDKVNGYFLYLWETRKATTPGTAVLKELPPTLSTEILMFLNERILHKVELFKDAGDIFIREVVQLLEPAVFLPGDSIIRQGEYGDCMYFLTSGTAEVLIGNDVVAVLAEGSPFGEAALLSGEKRTASIRAQSFCDVFKLSRVDFDVLRSKYPEFDQEVRRIMEARQKKNAGQS